MSAIEAAVCAAIQARASAGLAKYGTGMDRNDLTRAEWLRHAQEEAMDLAVYLERVRREDDGVQARLARAARVESVVRVVLTWKLPRDVRASLEAALAWEAGNE